MKLSHTILLIHKILLFLLLILLPLVDAFGGLTQEYFPASMFLRLVLFFMIFGMVFISQVISMQIKLLLSATLCFFSAQTIIHCFMIQDTSVFFVEMSATLKLLYFPLILIYLFSLVVGGQLKKHQINSSLILYGFMVLASLGIGSFTGLGAVIGGRGVDVEASKGFMIGANEVGLMLILTVPFVTNFFRLHSPFRIIPYLFALIIYSWAGFSVFTKSSLGAPIVAIVAILRTGFGVGNRVRKSFFGCILLLTLVAIAYYVLTSLDAITEFMLNTFFSSLFTDGIGSFLLRGRDTYVNAIYPQLISSDFNYLFFLFGTGEFYLRGLSVGPLMLESGFTSTFEMDVFDILGSYGVLGFFSYSLLIFLVIRGIRPMSLLFEVKLSLFFLIIHSVLAGHVLFSPQVTTILAFILIYYSRRLSV